MRRCVHRFPVPILALALLSLAACGKGDQPAHSDAATPPHGKAGVPHETGPRVETGVVDFFDGVPR